MDQTGSQSYIFNFAFSVEFMLKIFVKQLSVQLGVGLNPPAQNPPG